jgi:hypothetical protein
MTPTEKVALAMAWYDSGLEDRAAFQTLMESLFVQPEQEPVIDQSAAIRIATALGWTPQRPWVGLTDAEMHECWDSPLTPLGMKHARMIEAKLKQKNGYAEEKNT